MKMKRKTRFILILSLLVMVAVGLKPISHGLGKAVLQVISDRMDYEDAYRQKRQAEGHIVGGRGTAVIWEDTYTIVRTYHVLELLYRFTPYGQYACYARVLDNVTEYKTTKHCLYVWSDDGCAVVDDNNLCRLYTEKDTTDISDYEAIRCLSSFDEFSEEERKQLNKLKEKAEKDSAE